MLGFIAAVQKVVNDLRADYTTARAGKLDNCDAPVSGRAPASTALSSATWTGTKAGYLDAAISSRISIRQIVHGNVNSTSATYTLGTALVAINKAILIPTRVLWGSAYGGSFTAYQAGAGVVITNTTTVTGSGSVVGGSPWSVDFTLLEFN